MGSLCPLLPALQHIIVLIHDIIYVQYNRIDVEPNEGH